MIQGIEQGYLHLPAVRLSASIYINIYLRLPRSWMILMHLSTSIYIYVVLSTLMTPVYIYLPLSVHWSIYLFLCAWITFCKWSRTNENLSEQPPVSASSDLQNPACFAFASPRSLWCTKIAMFSSNNFQPVVYSSLAFAPASSRKPGCGLLLRTIRYPWWIDRHGDNIEHICHNARHNQPSLVQWRPPPPSPAGISLPQKTLVWNGLWQRQRRYKTLNNPITKCNTYWMDTLQGQPQIALAEASEAEAWGISLVFLGVL